MQKLWEIRHFQHTGSPKHKPFISRVVEHLNHPTTSITSSLILDQLNLCELMERRM